jgi:pimeloyl-ACP methyl ester carboxylesterase
VEDLEGLRRALGPDKINLYGFAAELLDGKWARNLELYFEFVGHEIDFFIGGQLGLIQDFRPLLKNLEMPVLIMAGRHDRAFYCRRRPAVLGPLAPIYDNIYRY